MPIAFDDLLARRDDLEEQHAAWCSAINDEGEDNEYTRGRRDHCYAELLRVQAEIEEVLALEKAEEGTQ